MPLFHVTLLTLFPDMFPGPLNFSLAGRALSDNIWSYEAISLRDFGVTKHKNVDDEPYGGGHGLVMRADVLGSAIDYALAKHPDSVVYYPSPRGGTFNQGLAREISVSKNIIILCGRFEGIDERIIDEYNVRQISVGDCVLSGGELPAMVVLDSVIRLLPGVLSNQETLKSESFEEDEEGNKLLEYPLYTKPAEWRGRKAPEILLSGDHQKVEKWRKSKSLEMTYNLRPDLLKKT